MKTRSSICVMVVSSVLWSACAREMATTPDRPAAARPAHVAYSLSAPVSDATMGAFSPIAQAIAAGLQDSTARVNVYRAMKSRALDAVAGLDLQACESDSPIKALLASAEHFGAGPAKDLCAFLTQREGAILYMDPSRLARWDGTTIPVVAARETMNAPLPQAIQVYRSPNRLMTMPTDGSMVGPIVYVLPIAHSSRRTNAAVPNIIVHTVPRLP